MSYADVARVIGARIAEQVETELSLPVAYPNAPFQRPSDGTSFARLTIQFSGRAQVTIGVPRIRGVVLLSILSPMSSGTAASFALADQVVAAFDQVTSEGVSYEEPQVVSSRRGDGVDSGYHQVNLSIDFRADQ